MSENGKLYICEKCGNIIQMVRASGVPVMCCGQKMAEYQVEEAPVCDLQPLDLKSNENYLICKCNNVSYFDILDEIHRHTDVTELLDMFEDVKNTTHCSTGCGGCYDKVIAVISAAMSGH